jgi:hypothetical protein
MMDSNELKPRSTFADFYKLHYLADHQHPANVALHIAGTLAGLAWIAAAITIIPFWWALLFPIVHAVPGLIGHRLFDRDTEVGDVRLLRKDFPLYWFIVANHILTARVLTGQQ